MRYFYYSEKAAKLNGAHALMVGGGRTMSIHRTKFSKQTFFQIRRYKDGI